MQLSTVDDIWVVLIVWRIRGKIIRTVLCCIVQFSPVITTLMWAVLTSDLGPVGVGYIFCMYCVHFKLRSVIVGQWHWLCESTRLWCHTLLHTECQKLHTGGCTAWHKRRNTEAALKTSVSTCLYVDCRVEEHIWSILFQLYEAYAGFNAAPPDTGSEPDFCLARSYVFAGVVWGLETKGKRRLQKVRCNNMFTLFSLIRNNWHSVYYLLQFVFMLSCWVRVIINVLFHELMKSCIDVVLWYGELE